MFAKSIEKRALYLTLIIHTVLTGGNRAALLGIINVAIEAIKARNSPHQDTPLEGSYKLMRPNAESRANIQYADIIICATYVPFVIRALEPTPTNFARLANVNLFDVRYPLIREAVKQVALLNEDSRLTCNAARTDDSDFGKCAIDYAISKNGENPDWYGAAYADAANSINKCISTDQYRAISGRCNNLKYQQFGKRQSLFQRFIPNLAPRYAGTSYSLKNVIYYYFSLYFLMLAFSRKL